MADLTQSIRQELMDHGADLVGFGDLTALPVEARENLPIGICVAVKYPREIIRGIGDAPTREYYDHYNSLNETLDALVTFGAETLQARGYRATAQTRAFVQQFETEQDTRLPHKTVATRAGLGWIGKSALFVTREYGSMIRLSTILTDAPLAVGQPIDTSLCGACTACTEACPAGAVSGKPWSVGMAREDFFDAAACRRVARERSLRSFGVEITICGKCIEVCPWTRRYLNGAC